MDPKVTINASDEMRALLSDAGIFQLKRAFIHEISRVWLSLCEQVQEEESFRKFNFPRAVDHSVPRIRKGENLHGLPWVLCDFPALFARGNVFALRNFFWWGKGFLFILQLSGAALDRYRALLVEKLRETLPEKYRISRMGSEWEYDPQRITLEKASALSADAIEEASFLKVMAFLPTDALDSFPSFYLQFQMDMLRLLSR